VREEMIRAFVGELLLDLVDFDLERTDFRIRTI
jgi:hypothetical protein